MTTAVCLQCGELKFGAFNECPSCGYQPDTPESQGRHVLVTDHYHSVEDLERIGAQVKAGETLSFDPAALEEATRLAAVLAPSSGGVQRRLLVAAVAIAIVVIVLVVVK